jgi:hypothetical protein
MGIRELRIHGVGGSPGERLLGLTHPDQAVVVGEGRPTVFLSRRRNRRIEGYDWGGLTSGSVWQPLWVLLLPFTLVNVAGWAHPAPDSISGRRLRALRALVHVSGALLTASWVVWTAIIMVDHLGDRWLGQHVGLRLAGVEPRVVGMLLGGLVTVGAMAALWAVARSSRARFEAVEADPSPQDEPERAPGWGLHEGLEDASFFAHETDMNERLAWHVGVIAATVLGLLGITVSSYDADRLALGEVLVVLGAAQLAVVGLLAVVSWTARPTGPASPPTPRQPPGIPAAAVTLAIALTNGVFAGLTLLAMRLTPGRQDPWGPELALLDVFVLVVVAWVVVAAAWVVIHRRRGDASELPARAAPVGRELDGVDPAMRAAVARARGLAAAGHDAARPLTWFAWLFLLAAAAASALRIEATWPFLSAPAEPTVVGRAAAWLLPSLVAVAIVTVWRSTRIPSLRRGIGILWDVLTFWPRRFHPLAVRPYTERAVPELQARIRHLVASDDGLLVSAHSQGTVLAAAALAPLDDAEVARVGLLTYGSPLTTLYGRVFPAYLGPDMLLRLRGRLQAGPAGWRNLWRATDPIGGPVIGADGDPAVDRECPDPATGPSSRELAEDDPDPEPLRRAWIELRGHSYYYREAAYKAAVAELTAALRRPPD